LPLTDGTVITRQQVAQSGYGKLLIYPTTSLPTGDKLWFYNGVTPLGIVDQPGRGGQTIVPQTGSNDIGILYQRQVSQTNRDGSTSLVYRYINFYRFNIILQDDPVMSVSPDSAVAFVGDTIPYTLTVSNAPADALYNWDFGDGQSLQTKDLKVNCTYNAEGAFYGRVSVASAANPGVELAFAEFSVTVSKNEDQTTLQTTVPGGTSNAEGWTSLLSNSGSVPEQLFTVAPASIPQDVGAKSMVTVTAPGRLRVTVSFASSMGTGPRFYGDEYGYRSYAAIILRDADGKLIDSEWILNDYDTEFAEQVLEISVAAPQTISIQIAPQSVSCYPETRTPASDGDGSLYLAGSYSLEADFKPGE